jgi:hypothetical protein
VKRSSESGMRDVIPSLNHIFESLTPPAQKFAPVTDWPEARKGQAHHKLTNKKQALADRVAADPRNLEREVGDSSRRSGTAFDGDGGG